MNILALDTALGACSVAVMACGEILNFQYEERTRGHAERLAPMVAEIFSASGLTPRDINRIGVTTGPGTFTGQRVGLAFARAFAVAIDVPVIGVTTLQALAAHAREQMSAQNAYDAIIAAVDARRNEIYIQLFDMVLNPLHPPQVLGLEAAAEMMGRGNFLIGGSGAQALAGHLQSCETALMSELQPDARQIAYLVSEMPVPDHAPHAFYLRAPDARLPEQGKPEQSKVEP